MTILGHVFQQRLLQRYIIGTNYNAYKIVWN